MQIKPLMRRTALLATMMAASTFATTANADITIGVTLSTTGPTAALGVPMKNALDFWPKEIAGEKLNVIFLDDAGDPTKATTNARRFVTDDKVDVIVGSDNTPTNIAIGGVAAEAGVPHFACAPTPLKDGREKWTFVMPQAVPLVGQILLDHMKANNVKSVGYIGFSDLYGDLWSNLLKGKGAEIGLNLVDDERFARADTSVSGQVLKLVAANPDAILVGASGAGAALPQVELRDRGYKGPIYQTHGAVSFAFIKIAGAAAEGVLMASGPVMVPEDQPNSALTKKPGLALNSAYEAKYGPNTRTQFAGHIYELDACPSGRRSDRHEDGKTRHAGIPRRAQERDRNRRRRPCQPGRLSLHAYRSRRARRTGSRAFDREGRQVRARGFRASQIGRIASLEAAAGQPAAVFVSSLRRARDRREPQPGRQRSRRRGQTGGSRQVP